MKLRYRKAVFILPYAKAKNGIEYLLLKRKLHWRGWEFAKGKIEKGESKTQAAKRELKEETGHRALKGRVKKFNFSGRFKYHKLLHGRLGFIGQTFSLYAAEVKKGKVSLDRKEHNGYKWVPFSATLKMLKWPNQKKSLKMVNSWLKGKRKEKK
jgi:8-oxo-dGTP pyrophosphatase MutT (NUDIX family)